MHALLVILACCCAFTACAAPNTNSNLFYELAPAQPVNWLTPLTQNVQFYILVSGFSLSVVSFVASNELMILNVTTGATVTKLSLNDCTVRYLASTSSPGLFFVGCSTGVNTWNVNDLSAPVATVSPPTEFMFSAFYSVGRWDTVDMVWIDLSSRTLNQYNTSLILDMNNGLSVWSSSSFPGAPTVDCPTTTWCAAYASDGITAQLLVVHIDLGVVSNQSVAPAGGMRLSASATDLDCVLGCVIVYATTGSATVLDVSSNGSLWNVTLQCIISTTPSAGVRFAVPLRPARWNTSAAWFVAVLYTAGNVTLFDATNGGSIIGDWVTQAARGINVVDTVPSAPSPSWSLCIVTQDVTRLRQQQTGACYPLSEGASGTWTVDATPVWTTRLDNVYFPTRGVYPVMQSSDGTRNLIAFPGMLTTGQDNTIHHIVSLIDVGTGDIYHNLLFSPTTEPLYSAFPPLFDRTAQAYIAWTSNPSGIASFADGSKTDAALVPGTGSVIELSWNQRLTAVTADGTISTFSILPNDGSLIVSTVTAALPQNFMITAFGSFLQPVTSIPYSYFAGYNETHSCLGTINNTPQIVTMQCSGTITFFSAAMNPGLTHLMAYGREGVVVLLVSTGAIIAMVMPLTQTVNGAAVDDSAVYVALDDSVMAQSLEQNEQLWQINIGSAAVSFGLSIGFKRTLVFCGVNSGFYEVDRATGDQLLSIGDVTCSPFIASTPQGFYYLLVTDANTSTTRIEAIWRGQGPPASPLPGPVAIPWWAYSDTTVMQDGQFTVTSDGYAILYTIANQVLVFAIDQGILVWATPNNTDVMQLFVDDSGQIVYVLISAIVDAGSTSLVTGYDTSTGAILMNLETIGTTLMSIVSTPTVTSPCTMMFVDDGQANGVVLYECFPTKLPLTYNPTPTPTTPTSQPTAPSNTETTGTDVVIVIVIIIVLGAACLAGYLFWRAKRRGAGGFVRTGYAAVDDAAAVDMASMRASSGLRSTNST